MTRLFGTDGIRGRAGQDLTPELAADVAAALATACRTGILGENARPRVVVGRDTRPSGPALENAVVDGLTRAGADAVRAGIVPTPAVAYLTSSLPAAAGVVVSASHNPPEDNGLKFFGPGGWKLTVDAEQTIEQLVGRGHTRPSAGAVDTVDAAALYVEHLCGHRRLDGVRVVVDCAHGAAFHVAPSSLRRLGAEVTAINSSADGARINEGSGAMHPEVVAAESAQTGAIGVTFDGDADRVLLADETGRVVDGDAIIALLALHLRSSDRLSPAAVVVTVMANQALRRWCDAEGIAVVETPVGDRHVLEAMRAHGLVLGGEQSGHIIVGDRTTTGDGLLTAVEALGFLGGRRLADAVPFEPFPQVLVNVAANGTAVDDAHVRSAVAAARRRLGEDGRVLVRPSGTEPLVRVMVEAPDRQLAADVAEDVAAAVRGGSR